MQVYIAMPPDKAAVVDAKKALSVYSLGLPSHVKYLPLKESEEHALQAAFKGNGMEVPMARDPSLWNILGVHVPESAAFEMVQAGKLIRDVKWLAPLCRAELQRLLSPMDPGNSATHGRRRLV